MAVVEFSFSEKQFDRIVRLIVAIPPTVDEAKSEGLFAMSAFMRRQFQSYILSNFETNNFLTSGFKKKFTRGRKLGKNANPWHRRNPGGRFAILRRSDKFSGPFHFMAPLARFIAFTRKNEVLFGFGTAQKSFNRRLLRIAKFMQEGFSVSVTPEMRRAIALTKGKKGQSKGAGVGIRKSTTMLRVKARPLYNPVFKLSRRMAAQIYRERTAQVFRERIKKAA